jgi:hypothetical protein
MTAFTYASLQTSLLVMLSQAPSPYSSIPADFTTLYPVAISNAENRIFRELVPVSNRQQNTTLATTAANRTLDLSGIAPLVVEGFALLSTTGVQIPFDAASLDAVDIIWPDSTITMDPTQADWAGRFWAMLDAVTIVFAPTVPGVYTAMVTGLFLPPSLASFATSAPTTGTTYLSSVYPDLLQAACMAWLAGGLLRNYGAQADDPRQAMSWETYFTTTMKDCVLEEQRRRGQGVGWSANMPTPVAQPPRT